MGIIRLHYIVVDLWPLLANVDIKRFPKHISQQNGLFYYLSLTKP